MLNHFNFKALDDGDFLLTNDYGRALFLSPQEFRHFLQQDIDPQKPLYERLYQAHFLLEPLEIYSDDLTEQLRQMKQYLFYGTALHIFVVTNQCNLRCIYCQAQDHHHLEKGMMSPETGRRAIDVALQSANHALSFEFQGGEPLLNFPVIQDMVLYAEQKREEKRIDFTVVSNLSLLTDEMADFFAEHHATICTSLDGPAVLHETNRRSSNSAVGSYTRMLAGLQKLHERGVFPGAIETTTRHTLPYARELLAEYVHQGLHTIFLRPLTPLGFAKSDWQELGYSTDEFLAFYRQALQEMFRLNHEGIRIKEQHAVFFLHKILQGHADNYMELRSPCGAGFGQLAYYYNGDVYTCDEGRMVAEAGDPAFRLGNVHRDTYEQLMHSDTCRATCAASVLEALPGCCDCVYQPYCGVCPVVQYAADGNIFPREAHSYRCRIYQGILDTLFAVLKHGTEEERSILQAWVRDDHEDNQ